MSKKTKGLLTVLVIVALAVGSGVAGYIGGYIDAKHKILNVVKWEHAHTRATIEEAVSGPGESLMDAPAPAAPIMPTETVATGFIDVEPDPVNLLLPALLAEGLSDDDESPLILLLLLLLLGGLE